MTLPKSIYHWSIDDVIHWLTENHFEMVIQDFKDNLIDGKALVLLNQNDIQELIKRIGPRVKFRAKLSHLLTSRNMKNYINGQQRKSEESFNTTSVYQHNTNHQYAQRLQYTPHVSNNNTPGNFLTPQQQIQQQQRMTYQTMQQQQPIKTNYPTAYPISNSQQTHLTNGSNVARMPQPITNEQQQQLYKTNTLAVTPHNFRSVKQPEQGTATASSKCKQCEEEAKQKLITENSNNCTVVNDSLKITQFIDNATHCKKEPLSVEQDRSSSTETEADASNVSDDTQSLDFENNNENLDPNTEKSLSDEEFDMEQHGEELLSNADNEEMASMMEFEHFPVLDISSESNDGEKLNVHNNNNKLGIEAVTNRLALRERSKIFRRSEKKWHLAVNETAYQLVLKDPKMLLRKKELRLIAESEVRKTYRFAKGKSRSIAIPANRAAAEERKKQKLTKEKIFEIKRQITSEGEEVSRRMRQCHMNLTLASQQSDATKMRELREQMQKLNQQQAKLHFSMDELLTKERKLDSGASKVLKAPNIPLASNYIPIASENNNNFMEINSQTSMINTVSPQYQSVDIQQPPSFVISPQSSLSPQVHIDETGRVLQISNSIMLSEDIGDNIENTDDDNNDDDEILPNSGYTALQETSSIAYVNI